MLMLTQFDNKMFFDIKAEIKAPVYGGSSKVKRAVVSVPIVPHVLWLAIKNKNKSEWIAARKKLGLTPITAKKAAAGARKAPKKAAAAPSKGAASPKKTLSVAAAPKKAAAEEAAVPAQSAPSKSDIAEQTTSAATEEIVHATSAREALDALSAKVVGVDEDAPETRAAPTSGTASPKKATKAAKRKRDEPAAPENGAAEAEAVAAAPKTTTKRARAQDDTIERANGHAASDALERSVGKLVVDALDERERSAEQCAVLDALRTIDGKLRALPDTHASVRGPWANVDARKLTVEQKTEIASAVRTLRYARCTDALTQLLDAEALVRAQREKERANSKAAKKVAFIEPSDAQAAADLALFDD